MVRSRRFQDLKFRLCVKTARLSNCYVCRNDALTEKEHNNIILNHIIICLTGTGRLISLCDDNSLHLWEINEKSLVELRSHTFEGKNKKVSSLCVESTGKHLLLGTEGGNVYSLDLNTLVLSDDAIYQDVVMQK